jgi:hypothetical protein
MLVSEVMGCTSIRHNAISAALLINKERRIKINVAIAYSLLMNVAMGKVYLRTVGIQVKQIHKMHESDYLLCVRACVRASE